ncbi:glycoside hydrolase family 35 protein [Microterricola pindariensis]|uniref:Beta-galactosidase n=1 Tax=Microterricola pindariensis TaxID=478010 RepID=A0ABX5ATX9_9MICO|nr:beta-galactosidase family protein [Microterricola pindariensis]PPL15452.1 beta-galactosidase [Microterricola pindariensis]
MPSFAIGATDFLLDGAPFRVLSGALHYFRVHPEHWADRIHKARLMGLNTIETYVPWNEHSPTRGEFLTTPQLDLARFLDLVHAEGMHAIVRPGPYICAEWTDGGLPDWLTADPSMVIRTNDPAYMAAVTEYLRAVYAIVGPRQVQHGGPVILVQIENEYGAYAADKDYLRGLTAQTRASGIEVPLTTVDQPSDQMLADGGLDELHKTGSFGSRASERLATLRRHQPTGPLMCSEFWCGWFDAWGAPHRTTSAADAARELDALLAAGASVNIYMFHGGTNFGFTSGADDKGTYRPTITSYDYDAPLAEDGTPTEKFWRFREVLAKYGEVPEEAPAERTDTAAFEVHLDRCVPLRHANLVAPSTFEALPDATALGAARGFSVYSTQLEHGGLLAFTEVRDRAQLFLNRAPIGVLNRDHHDRVFALPPEATGELTLLVEHMGGVNYGHRIGEPKGLIGPATLDGEPLTGWVAGPVALEEKGRLSPVVEAALEAADDCAPGPLSGPAFARGTFELESAELGDLHLDTNGWGKGVAWLNGFNLGRYWSRGPQRTLYVPAPVLRAGRNEIVIFETAGAVSATARFVARPDLGSDEA